MLRPKKKSPTRRRRAASLTTLSPIEFEHLVFDLMVARGMVNVSWRTPGADGGRDIEGTTIDYDLTGTQIDRKWFVECKKYRASVDWPTIYEKLAYADSHQVDVLLLCTTSTFSPNAITQVDAWNAARRGVTIRLWPKHELELQLLQHPDLAFKYRLSSLSDTPGRSFIALALALSKTVSSHYSRLVFQDQNPDRMIQASQALADLLLNRMEDMQRHGAITVTLPDASLTVPNCTFEGGPPAIDESGLRAFLVYLCALSSASLTVRASPSGCSISSSSDVSKLVQRYADVFAAIAIWSDLEFDASKKGIRLWQRK